MNANIRRLSVAFVVIFGLISFDLIFWQVIDAGSLNGHPGNPRTLIAAERVLRGRIYDRNGRLLTGRLVYPDGYVQPLFKDASLAQTLGYHSVRYGDSGLERTLDPYLSGKSGTSWSQTYDSWLHRPVAGDNVYLTIDERVQQAAASALQGVLAGQGLAPNTPAGVVALDPRSGEVLALLSQPYYNATCLDSPDQGEEQRCWNRITSAPGNALINRAINGLYPPGSTFKTLTLSAAIDAGIQSLSSEYRGAAATGPFVVDGYSIPNTANNLPPGVTSASLLQAFTWSDNIVFAQVGLRLGWGRFLDYARRFHLGSSIPFDLPVSISGVLRPGERRDPVALATSAFGQGSDHVTPMQMALIASTIADGGRMPKPVLIHAIKTPGGTTVASDSPGTVATPINPLTAAQVRHAMVQEVSGYYGSGFEAQIPGIQVAGKTGTAQTGTNIVDTWFICFAPANHPKIAVAVVVEGGSEGAFVAAPIAKQIMQAALQYGE